MERRQMPRQVNFEQSFCNSVKIALFGITQEKWSAEVCTRRVLVLTSVKRQVASAYVGS